MTRYLVLMFLRIDRGIKDTRRNNRKRNSLDKNNVKSVDRMEKGLDKGESEALFKFVK